MLNKIDGPTFAELLGGGVANLEKHRNALNDLNVFPVPDGDTGTNMVMTLRRGYEAIQNKNGDIGELAARFASAAVFGARGNSGVIVSQFFKGVGEALAEAKQADCDLLDEALRRGYERAYSAVAQPVEGTILTVLREASQAVSSARPHNSVEQLVDVYLDEARRSLERTPELLPVLKKANVVDSGGSGIVHFFEGVRKRLSGEEIELEAQSEASGEAYVDLSLFNKDTSFEYGYCVEGLIQLRCKAEDFDINAFRDKLSAHGSSMVVSLEGDKVKLHIHAKKLGTVMDCCQSFGELLTVKIENMTVQNAQRNAQLQEEQPEEQKFLYSPDRAPSQFAIVAVAANGEMQRRFFDMGADVVIMSDIAPSSEDFMEAFRLTAASNVLVFPNSSNSILSSMQAASLYKNLNRKSKVAVLNSRSMAECYAALSIIDLDGALAEAAERANDAISDMYEFSVYHAKKDIKYGSRHISKNDYFALTDKKILAVGGTLDEAAVCAVRKTLDERECAVITLFYGKNVPDEYAEDLAERLGELDEDIEIATVSTLETICDITITFE